jgi:DNA-binding winged helix-turn-helix (wHTH) protein
LANGARELVLRVGRWTIDPHTRQLAIDGQPAPVGERAFDLLMVLAAAAGTVVATDTLLRRVWPGRVVEENNLHVHVAALRKLLGPDVIRTVSGRGYQLTPPPDDGPAHAEPAAASLRPSPGNLPRALWPLVGREGDLQTLRQLLSRQRTVTVTGPAGVGKTSLALAMARELAASATGGAWMVELAGTAGGADATPLAESVARVLGISLPGLQQADDELVDVLRQRPMLLVLDNCEHRAHEAGQLVDRLTHDTASVRVLATSQVPLQHRAEQVFRLGTLALPPPDATAAEARAAGAVDRKSVV